MWSPVFVPWHCVNQVEVAHVCNPSTQEVEAGGSKVQRHPWLHSSFNDSLRYMKSCLERRKRRGKKEEEKKKEEKEE